MMEQLEVGKDVEAGTILEREDGIYPFLSTQNS